MKYLLAQIIAEILQVLLCGDIRGNLVLFPLLKIVLLRKSEDPNVEISALTYFKGAHGISSVTSVAFAGLNPNQTEMHSVWSIYLLRSIV